MQRPLALAALGLLLACACRPPEAASPSGPSESRRHRESDDLGPTLPPLQKEDLVIGTGPEAKQGDHVVVHYTGTLMDGTKFDSSLDRGTPFDFTIGQHQVIAGWELGVVGMKKGGKRRLVIPPHLGYDVQGSPPKIPPNATLKFEIELLEID